jgi:hypothetical protein
LIGKRYKEEKKAVGENQYTSKTTEDIKRVDHSEPPKTTAQKIAEQSKVGQATVKRAEKFADAVDKVAENTGIKKKRKL